jgi:hypothetical protein
MASSVPWRAVIGVALSQGVNTYLDMRTAKSVCVSVRM